MDAALIRACQDFEAAVLRPMFASLTPATSSFATEDGANNGDQTNADGAGGIISSLFADTLATAFARAGGLGIARELARTLASR